MSFYNNDVMASWLANHMYRNMLRDILILHRTKGKSMDKETYNRLISNRIKLLGL